jgi:hypothetical protein
MQRLTLKHQLKIYKRKQRDALSAVILFDGLPLLLEHRLQAKDN